MTNISTNDEQAHEELRVLTERYVKEFSARLAEVESPLAREGVARMIVDALLTDAVRQAKIVRSDAIRELKQGRTLKQVAEMTGLSIPRVDQLVKWS
ncbi:hypothetical protein [Streptomyces sp. NPDC048606]|uniref:hypothetical protein n=1 Tax=Streptomyces sp. NPDC048606 TaxID=3154726 RepID=UPI00342EE921